MDSCKKIIERIRVKAKATTMLASTPAVSDGWQPIKSAPKDGTSVLVYEGETTKRMWRAQWDESIGWMFGATSDDHIACAFFRVNPTHWMPLPAAPPDRVARIANAVVDAEQGADNSDPMTDSAVPEQIRRVVDDMRVDSDRYRDDPNAWRACVSLDEYANELERTLESAPTKGESS